MIQSIHYKSTQRPPPLVTCWTPSTIQSTIHSFRWADNLLLPFHFPMEQRRRKKPHTSKTILHHIEAFYFHFLILSKPKQSPTLKSHNPFQFSSISKSISMTPILKLSQTKHHRKQRRTDTRWVPGPCTTPYIVTNYIVFFWLIGENSMGLAPGNPLSERTKDHIPLHVSENTS